MGKALLLEAAAPNGVSSPTFPVAMWWLHGLAVGLSVVLFYT